MAKSKQPRQRGFDPDRRKTSRGRWIEFGSASRPLARAKSALPAFDSHCLRAFSGALPGVARARAVTRMLARHMGGCDAHNVNCEPCFTRWHAEPKSPAPTASGRARPHAGVVRAQLLGAQERRGPAIRSTFLEEYGNARAPGPLQDFVSERRLFALQLHPLLMCVARKAEWDATLSASTWAMALDRTNKSAEGTVSRNWAWLEDKRLVETERDHRRLSVTRRLEDGTGTAYQRPKGNFFIFPLDSLQGRLAHAVKLPGTAGTADRAAPVAKGAVVRTSDRNAQQMVRREPGRAD